MKNPVEEGAYSLQLECGCHAEYLRFDYDEWDQEDWREVFISHVIPSFYALQNVGIWTRFTHALAIIWKIITGKEYEFFSVAIEDASQIKALKEFLSHVDENRMLYNGKD